MYVSKDKSTEWQILTSIMYSRDVPMIHYLVLSISYIQELMEWHDRIILKNNIYFNKDIYAYLYESYLCVYIIYTSICIHAYIYNEISYDKYEGSV